MSRWHQDGVSAVLGNGTKLCFFPPYSPLRFLLVYTCQYSPAPHPPHHPVSIQHVLIAPFWVPPLHLRFPLLCFSLAPTTLFSWPSYQYKGQLRLYKWYPGQLVMQRNTTHPASAFCCCSALSPLILLNSPLPPHFPPFIFSFAFLKVHISQRPRREAEKRF